MALSTPSKAVFSSAQNPVKSITPGYRETDIALLARDAERPILLSAPSSEEPTPEFYAASTGRRRELFCEIAASYGVLTMGLNDGAPGALLPSIEQFYSIDYAVVSLIFLSKAVGFIFASFLSHRLHIYLGRCKSLVIGAGMQGVSYILLSFSPPYWVVIVSFWFSGAGMGFQLAHMNTYMATRTNAVKVLGYMHSCYGVGATLAPIIATQFISHSLPWSHYFIFTLGLQLVSIVGVGLAFLNQDGPLTEAQRGKLRVAMHSKVTWIASAFIFLYQGAEVALGGWLVTFMIQVRGGDPSTMGYTATGFWLGITIGRMIMGHTPTGKLGQKRIVYIYLGFTLVLYMLFWLIPSIVASSLAVALVGMSLGPIYPCTMNVLSKLVMDRELLVAVVGIVGGLGNAGGAIAPFTTGLLAQSRGVWVLQPVILSLVASMLAVWWGLPNIPSRSA